METGIELDEKKLEEVEKNPEELNLNWIKSSLFPEPNKVWNQSTKARRKESINVKVHKCKLELGVAYGTGGGVHGKSYPYIVQWRTLKTRVYGQVIKWF